ncbi:two-component response regulator-like APRR5 [Coffea arabica]|uniref:Two-component response regulator-like APRR5 n=1 Tax=Coffea arabica TaxID=13443 RepID=A0ABM4WBW3_COFAR
MGEVVVSSDDGGGAMELQVKETERAAAQTGKGRTNDNIDGSTSSAAATPASSIVRWESFLPKMVLRVLLVEADDSTRQIIAALLRKCNYRVAAVPDGLKAWEVLKGRPHDIDLILTEVELPSISGFALLTLIMEHEICKNIPVIMMSSQDSVSTVYKCMLRGAADFLVKPVRKNELRNLWQHVWRRQAASSAGQGPPDESVAQQKVEATAENNAVSNYSSDYMACIQKNRECFEKGSDAQSSCTKPEQDTEGAEMECMQGLSHPQWSKQSNLNIEQQEGCDNASKKVQVSDNGTEGSQEASGKDRGKMAWGEDLNSGVHWERYHVTYHGRDNVKDSAREAIDLIGAFDNYLKCTDRSIGSNAGTNKFDLLPQLDLSLRRSLPSVSVNQIADERHRLNHSDASAFSRYVNRNVQPQPSTSPSTCNQQKEQKSNSDKQLSNHTIDYNSDTHGPTINSQKHVDWAIGQSGESDARFSCPQPRSLPAPIPVRGVRFDRVNNSYGSLIPQAFGTQSGLSSVQPPGSVSHQEVSFGVNAMYQLNHQPGNQQQFSGLMTQNTSDTTDQNENNEGHKVEDRGHVSSATDQSANSSFCNGTVNHLHSLCCGSNEKIDTVPLRSAAECGSEEAFRVQDGNSIRSIQREAALTKFRLKRKERCFEKKVRYESRKKLAEKRPRVKGQFVRQVLNEFPLENP